MIGIYKITSPSGKVYIGQTWNTTVRFSKYKIGDSKRQPKLHSSFLSHGFGAHKIEMCQILPHDISQDVMNQLEIAYIEIYKDAGIELLNIAPGGNNCKPSEETRKKRSLATKGVPLHIRIGKENADKQRLRMSLAKKGVPHSKEHIENIRKGLLGKKLSIEHINKLRGQKRTPEQLKKFRDVQLGKKQSIETKAKMSEIHKKRLALDRLNKTGRYANK